METIIAINSHLPTLSVLGCGVMMYECSAIQIKITPHHYDHSVCLV